MRLFKWFALVLLFFIAVIASVFIAELRPANALAGTKEILIDQGESRSQIAGQLFDASLIKNQTAFLVYSRLIGLKILPGTYELSAALSATDIADKLMSGKLKTVRVTIIEGWRAKNIENYLVNDRHLTQLTGFTQVAESDEGYLFPDTYDFKVDITTPEVIAAMKENFKKKTEGLSVDQDVVIMASIVEREARDDSDRAPIAGVYANRLKIGMKLEADPTVQYAKGNWKAVTVEDYKNIISPYNTYLHEGLPPGPISNPGLASIKAALNPAQSDYLYFFHAKGQTFFSKTLEEHQAKVRQYFGS